MQLAHFYHVYCDGCWREPVAEHLDALQGSGFRGPLCVGLVGAPDSRSTAFGALWPALLSAQADRGWEQVTLAALAEWAWAHPQAAVMYAHTKGAAHPTPENADWRREMTERLIRRWRVALLALEGGAYDAAGPRWLYPDHPFDPYPAAHFSGNYWMASCEYINRLPRLRYGRRHAAEVWVGRGDPRVLEMRA